MAQIEVCLWRSQSFINSVWSDADFDNGLDPETIENYSCPDGVYLNYRQLLKSNDNQDVVLATINDQGQWQSAASGQIYSDITISS